MFVKACLRADPFLAKMTEESSIFVLLEELLVPFSFGHLHVTAVVADARLVVDRIIVEV